MSTAPKSLLVVDDYQGIRDGVTSLLQTEGYRINTAANGREAIELLKHERIDLIITDILMPEMDGLELVKHVQSEHPDMKFILISGGGRHLDGDSVPDFLAMGTRLTGVSSVLKKPFKPDLLVQMVEELLAD